MKRRSKLLVIIAQDKIEETTGMKNSLYCTSIQEMVYIYLVHIKLVFPVIKTMGIYLGLIILRLLNRFCVLLIVLYIL